jgi:hypothetical protein
VTWLMITAALILALAYLGHCAAKEADAEGPGTDHYEGYTCAAGGAMLRYSAARQSWVVDESDTSGRDIAVSLFRDYNAAADYYESLCDRLREDAARDKAVQS